MGPNKMLIQKSQVSKTLALFAMAVFISGCFGSKPEPKPESCTNPFEKTIHAEIKGGHLYFDITDLSFLLDKGLILEDIDLSVTLRGKHHVENEIDISFNGVKSSRKDGGRNIDRCEYEDGGDTSRPYFKLHKFSLNGGEPFDKFLSKIYTNRGVLKLSLHGQNTHIIAAAISFSGKKYVSCPAPNPNPDPTPEPEIATTLDSVVPAEATTNSTDVVFNFSSNIQGSSFWCSLDSSPAEQCDSPKSYTGLTNGSHTFSVYAKSPKGAVDNSPATHSWNVDAQAPSVTITNLASLPGLTQGNSISFEFFADEASAFECHLDDQIPTTCESPTSYSGLGDGIHSFAVRAIDSVGNAGVAATFQWTVDQTAPIARIVDVSPAAAVSNVSSKAFTFAANESSSFECSVDNGPFASCTSPVNLSGLDDGNHWFEVRATDAAGNLGAGASYSWSIDTAAPAVTIASVNPAQGATNANSVFADFNVSEPSTMFYSWDGGTSTEFSGSFSISDVADGAHSLVVYATDAAGNRSADVVLSWTVDRSLPVLSFGAITPAGSVINSTSLTAEVNSSKSATLNVSLNHMSLGQAVSPISLSNLTEGSYVLSVTATDSVGNVSAPISHAFVVDLTAPTVSLAATNTANPSNSDNNSFNFTASEAVEFECNLDEAGFSSCVSPHSASGLADGSHSFQIRATDAAGNVSATASYSWVVDTRAPVTTLAASQTGNDVSFTIFADESPVTFSCGLNSGPNSACGSSVSYSNLADGDYTFVAQATDAAGNTGTIASWTFRVESIPVTTITSIVPAANIASNSSVRTVSFASDVPGSSFVCTLNGGAEEACASPVEYTGLVHGTYNFKVVAISPSGARDPVGASATWVVDTVAPVITSFAMSATSRSITITWTTDEPSTRQVFYGTGGIMNQSTVESTTYSTSHSVTLSNLNSGTTYTLRVQGKDAAGNLYVSPVQTRRTN
jgi:large repetitive protein